MKFDIISDIHLERNDICHWTQAIEKKSEYLIIAGDVAQISHLKELSLFLGQLCEESKYKHIYYVCGNHEFYNDDSESIDTLILKFQKRMSEYSNFTILQNTFVEIEDIVIFGSTLWSKLPENYNISLPIFDKNQKLITYNWYLTNYYYSLWNLDNAIQHCQQQNKKLLVVTHYCPTFEKTLETEHYSSDNRFMYCSEMDQYLSKFCIHTWVFGHTHVNVDYVVSNGTRIVTNQYRAKKFSKNKQIEI